nr:Uncharacterised protein [Klebsiella pneumoniae]
MPPVRMMKVIPAASTMLIEARRVIFSRLLSVKSWGDKAENGDDQDEDRQNADGLHQVAHQHFFRRSGFRDRRGGLFGMLIVALP